MAPTLAIIGYGTLFQTSDGNSPPTWSALAEVTGLDLPEITRDVVDAGHECAPGEWREVLTGIRNAAEISVACNFYKTTYQALLAELTAVAALKARRIVLPGGTFLAFDAFLIGLQAAAAPGDKIAAVAKFRPSGAPSLTVV